MNLLKFLRKYQKAFFVIITSIIIISFSFFGSYSAFEREGGKNKDEKIGVLLTGKPLMRSEVEKLTLFLSSYGEEFLTAKGTPPNLFNDGVLQQDFLTTNLAPLLAKSYFDQIKKDLDVKFLRVKNFAPYSHPAAPFISAKFVWSQLKPQINSTLEEVAKSSEVNLAYFSKMLNLYLEERSFPPDFLKRVLIYQQNQYQDIQVDQELYYNNLALFGFEGVEDWFGKNFIDLASQVILNMAAVAEEKGYKVTKEEAKLALLDNLQKNLAKQKNPFYKGVKNYYSYQLRLLRLDDGGAIELWRKVMLFRRMMKEESSILIDPISSKEFLTFADDKRSVDLYTLKESVKLKDSKDLLGMQLYLQNTYGMKDQLLIKDKRLSVSDVEKNAKELIKKSFFINVGYVNIDELALNIGEKELWGWQQENKNWATLKEKFSEIKEKGGKSRFEVLEALAKPARQKIDDFSRKEMLQTRQGVVLTALNSAKMEEKQLNISTFGKSALEGIENNEKLSALLEKAPIKGEGEPLKELLAYSEDNVHFWRFELLKKGEKGIFSYEEAKKEGILDHMVSKKLKEEYERLKELSSATTDKPFEDAKEKVTSSLLKPIFIAIDNDFIKIGGKISWKKGEGKIDFYGKKRFFANLRDLREKLLKDPSFLSSNDDGAFSWLFEVKGEEITRSYPLDWVKKEVFGQAETQANAFSKVRENDIGEPLFFRFIGNKGFSKEMLMQIALKEKELLSNEAKEKIASNFVKDLISKRTIVLPIRPKEVVKEEVEDQSNSQMPDFN